MDMKDIEKYSSAYTLSDMEIFIFPELMYSLVLANIMSPDIWKWREDPWFAKLEGKMTPTAAHAAEAVHHGPLRLQPRPRHLGPDRPRSASWSASSRSCRRSRSPQSNALFGYEGDKYYFDIDIRRHFGLDKYKGDVIPYWKTETVEAMDAFRLKPGYGTGAGECVSLATLYAAALFIVCGIPLEDIFLMATPAALAELRRRGGRHPHQQPPAGDQDHVVQRHRALRPGPARPAERAGHRRGPQDRLHPQPLPRGHHRPEGLRAFPRLAWPITSRPS